MVKYQFYFANNGTFSTDSVNVYEYSVYNVDVKENEKFDKDTLINSFFSQIYMKPFKNYVIEVEMPLDIHNLHNLFKPIFSISTSGSGPYTHTITELNDLKSASLYLTGGNKTINLKSCVPTSYNFNFEVGKRPKAKISFIGEESTTTRTLNTATQEIFYPYTTAQLTFNSLTKSLAKASISIDTNYKPLYYLDSTTMQYVVDHNYSLKITGECPSAASDFDNFNGSGNINFSTSNRHFKVNFNGSSIQTKEYQFAGLDFTTFAIEAGSFSIEIKNGASS